MVDGCFERVVYFLGMSFGWPLLSVCGVEYQLTVGGEVGSFDGW